MPPFLLSPIYSRIGPVFTPENVVGWRFPARRDNLEALMTRLVTSVFLPVLIGAAAVSAHGQNRPAQLPDAPGRQTFTRICSACHPAELVLGKGMSREQWGSIVSNMISRGAKGSDEEFGEIIDYLSKNFPPNAVGRPPAGQKRLGGSLLDEAGASDKQVVDEAAANRGKTIYIAQCISCHGPKGRGTDRGADLVRSLVILHDRYGNVIGPFLAKGHPTQSGTPSSSFTEAQILDLSHFLHQKVGDTLRTGPYNKVINVLTGDPKAGEAYFNGPGKCSTCHSPTGDLHGIASKYDPAALQLRVVFPQTVAFGRRSIAGGKKPVTVTVTTPSGERVSGVLLEIDDFNVSLRDAAGQYRTFKRTPELKVEKNDPYAAHVALLDQYTDKDIHDLVAYLETLK
jgi:mono/diheme cytochrome c family protein